MKSLCNNGIKVRQDAPYKTTKLPSGGISSRSYSEYYMSLEEDFPGFQEYILSFADTPERKQIVEIARQMDREEAGR